LKEEVSNKPSTTQALMAVSLLLSQSRTSMCTNKHALNVLQQFQVTLKPCRWQKIQPIVNNQSPESNMRPNHALAHFTWLPGSGSWSAGFCGGDDPVGYHPPAEFSSAASYVAEIDMNLGTAEEIAPVLIEHARQAGIELPNAPTF
jgi:hypothetical protein